MAIGMRRGSRIIKQELSSTRDLRTEVYLPGQLGFLSLAFRPALFHRKR